MVCGTLRDIFTEWSDILQDTDLEILWDLDALQNDPATCEMIRRGETMGCFYIESPSMRSLFRRMHCRTYEDVVAATSIIRPGVAESGMMQEYVERRRDARKVKHPHPVMGELLAETYGVMVYQEDVIKVVHALGGFTLGEADLLRRAMSGKAPSREVFRQMTERFFAGCRERAIPEETIREIWRRIESFAGYSFCKGHSAAFSVLSFQVAYLKAHYPAEFMASVLSNGGGYYGPGAYVQECRRMGLRVLGPDVNESMVDYVGRSQRQEVRGKKQEARGEKGSFSRPDSSFSRPDSNLSPPQEARSRRQSDSNFLPLASHLSSSWVRIGFGAIKNFPLDLARRILCVRRERPFEGFEDFLRRVQPGPEAAEKLIRVGAFDRFGVAREQLILELDLHFRTESGNAAELDLEAKQSAQPTSSTRESQGGSPTGGSQCSNPTGREGDDEEVRGKKLEARESESALPSCASPLTSDFARRMADEIELLGYGVAGHPLELLPPEVWRDTIPARELDRYVGRRITMIGWQITAKLLRTRVSREFMKFLSLEDLTATFEVTLFPKAYRRFAPLTVSPGPFRVTGKVEDDQGAVSLVAEELEILGTTPSRASPAQQKPHHGGWIGG